MDDFSHAVLKFGGTSMAQHQDKIKEIVEQTHPRFIVVSAPGKSQDDARKTTDLLYTLAYESGSKKEQAELQRIILGKYAHFAHEKLLHQFGRMLEEKLKQGDAEHIMALGEYFGARAMADRLGYSFLDALDLFFLDRNGKVVKEHTLRALQEQLSHKHKVVIPGFYGRCTSTRHLKLMGRGSSDITGAYIAAALQLDSYQNFTDSGIARCNPSIVPDAEIIPELTFEELGNLSSPHFQILHRDVVKIARESNVPLYVRSTRHYPLSKTKVVGAKNIVPYSEVGNNIKALSYEKELSTITFKKYGLDRESGVLKNIYTILHQNDIDVKTSNICIDDISIDIDEKTETSPTYEIRYAQVVEEVSRVYPTISIACHRKHKANIIVLAASKKRVHYDALLETLFVVLHQQGIPIKTINKSENGFTIIIGIASCDTERAMKSLHEKFIRQKPS